jgi:hypothetical protein
MLFAQAGLDHKPAPFASQVAGTCATMPSLFVEIGGGLTNFLPRLSFNHILPISTSQSVGITSMYHYAQCLKIIFLKSNAS